jgi:hypothetical protein
MVGGSKLNKFMQSVDDLTSTLPSDPVTTDADQALTEFDGKPSREAKPRRNARADVAREERATTPSDPWSGLLQAGMAMLTRLVPEAANSTTSTAKPAIERDAQTGEPMLRLPVPPPEVVEQALTAIARLLESFRK